MEDQKFSSGSPTINRSDRANHPQPINVHGTIAHAGLNNWDDQCLKYGAYPCKSGRLGLRQIDLGNMVQPTDANGLVSITQTQPISVVFAVPAT